MPDETHLVSDKLFITDNLHIKENEEFVTLLDFVHKHSITNLKFPIEAGIDEDSYDTQAQVIAALEEYLKPSSASSEDIKSIWLLKRKDGKIEPQDDTRDEFYFNETEQHLERIGSTKIDFSDITDDVTFKAAVTFQTPDGKNVVFIKSPKVGDHRVLDEGDVQQTINNSLLPPSSNAVKTYVDNEKLTLVKENTDEGKVYIGPNSNLTVGPNDSTFKTPIKLNSTGVTSTEPGTLSNDDGVLKWNGEEVGGSLTIHDNNQDNYYTKTKQLGFQGGYVAMTKDDITGEVKLFIRENKDFKYPSISILTSPHSSGYIYTTTSGNSYDLPMGKSSGALYDQCLRFTNAVLYYQFKDENSANEVKFDVDSTLLENTTIKVKIFSGERIILNEVVPLSSIIVDEIPLLDSKNFVLYTKSEPLRVWPSAHSSQEYEDIVNEQGKTPFTIQYNDLYIAVKQSLVENGGSLRVEIFRNTPSGDVGLSSKADAFLYKIMSGYPTINCSLKSGTSPAWKNVSGIAYYDTGTQFEVTASIRDSQYYYNANSQSGYIDMSQFGVSQLTYLSPVNPPTQTVSLTKSFSLASGRSGERLQSKLAVYNQLQAGEVSSWASEVVDGPFWSKDSPDNPLSEDFWGETKGRTNYQRKTANNGTWSSTLSIDDPQPQGSTEYGLQVKYGQLIYPPSPYLQNVTRTYYRWFKGSGASTLNRFDITVAGTLPNDFFNANGKTRLEILNNGNYYRINALESAGGIAKSTPSSGKWRCEYSSVMTKPSVGDGFFLKISTTDTSLKLGKITVVMNPA